MFDTFRGLLIVLVLVLHFTRVAGNFSQASLGGVIYITLISNVNHALIFLSGFFSKNPDRSKQTSFHTLMWPYILGIPFFYCVRYIIWGSANWNLATPPFAMWYLWVLFFYRYFTKEWMRVPHILALSVLMYLLAGQIPFLTDIFGLGRLISFFPFFIIAVYCTKDQIKKVQCLKKWHCLLLGTALTGISCVLAFCVPQLPVEFYLLKRPAGALGISWYWDIIGRVIVMAEHSPRQEKLSVICWNEHYADIYFACHSKVPGQETYYSFRCAAGKPGCLLPDDICSGRAVCPCFKLKAGGKNV